MVRVGLKESGLLGSVPAQGEQNLVVGAGAVQCICTEGQYRIAPVLSIHGEGASSLSLVGSDPSGYPISGWWWMNFPLRYSSPPLPLPERLLLLPLSQSSRKQLPLLSQPDTVSQRDLQPRYSWARD